MAFTPTVWSQEIDMGIKEECVANKITNDNYEGEVKNCGDTVKIFIPGDISISPYEQQQDISSPEYPTDGDDSLVIDQQFYFNFAVDDIDALQENVKKLKAYREKAKMAVCNKIDSHVLSLYPEVYSDNIITPDSPLATDNVFDIFNDAYTELSENYKISNGLLIPAIISPRVQGVIRSYLASRNTPWGDQIAKDGHVGNFAGFALYASKNLSIVQEDIDTDGTDEEVHKIMVGFPDGITRAEQLLKIEDYRPEKKFADAVKGLFVYGAKMLKNGKATCCINAYFEN